MICSLDTKDYLKRKLSGEDVISSVSLYGLRALSQQPQSDSLLVLDIDGDGFAYYRYAAKDGRIQVVAYDEDVPLPISSVFEGNLLHCETVSRWWEHVFFEHNGIIGYDPFYDMLHVSEDSSLTFKGYIEKVTSLLEPLLNTAKSAQVFVRGDIARSPLIRYVFQQSSGLPVKLLGNIKMEGSFNENEWVFLPDEELAGYILNLSVAVKFSQMAPCPLTVTLPISSLDSELTSGIKWSDLLLDKQADFRVGELEFKVVNLRVECDSFQNAFLACEDMRGHRKVIHLIESELWRTN